MWFYLFAVLGALSALAELASVPLQPIPPEVHPLFPDYASSARGIPYQISNLSYFWTDFNVHLTCGIDHINLRNGSSIAQMGLDGGGFYNIDRRGKRNLSCALAAPSTMIAEAKINFFGNYEWHFLWFTWRRELKTEDFFWDGHRWFESDPP